MRVFLAGLPLFILAGCGNIPFLVSKEDKVVLLCEEHLKGELKSPASYKRTWSNYTPGEPMTRDEMLGSYEDRRVEAVRNGSDADAFFNAFAARCLKKPKDPGCEGVPSFEESPHPKTAFVLLEYEAVNSFNASLPGFYSCRINVFDDAESSDVHVMTSGTVPINAGKRLRSQAEAFQ